VLAGLAGSLAEVLWIGLVLTLTPVSGEAVLRQISASFFPAIVDSASAPALGLVIHFALGVGLAYGFWLCIWRPFVRSLGAQMMLYAAIFSLTVIWFLNFFVVLPVVNSGFVDLIPYAATLVSKILFGIAMAATLYVSSRASSATVAKRAVGAHTPARA